jgi:sugar phosphate isomerase/epimerase
MYQPGDVEAIRRRAAGLGLRLLDLHGSIGPARNWMAADEAARRSGVELVVNRMQMTASLGADVVIMHVPAGAAPETVRRSMDEVAPLARRLGVRLAVENGDFGVIRAILDAYGPDVAGLCYDSGHGNIRRDDLPSLDALRGRLISVHLHDNDGTGDQHNIPFSGTVDWPRLADLVARSSYRKCVSLEVSIGKSGFSDEGEFLAASFRAGTKLSLMIEQRRQQEQ